jgi:hypothetical protein
MPSSRLWALGQPRGYKPLAPSGKIVPGPAHAAGAIAAFTAG